MRETETDSLARCPLLQAGDSEYNACLDNIKELHRYGSILIASSPASLSLRVGELVSSSRPACLSLRVGELVSSSRPACLSLLSFVWGGLRRALAGQTGWRTRCKA